MENGNSEWVEDAATAEQHVNYSKSDNWRAHVIIYSIVAVLFSVSTFAIAQHVVSRRRRVENVSLVLHGGLAVNGQDLKTVIHSQQLNVYWLGPVKGAKYLLDASNPKAISLQYVFNTGSMTVGHMRYYEIGTFVSPSAFSITRSAALRPNGVGFINADGNAVFYDSRDPKNVYVGLKGVNVQIEIYDPIPDQALASALLPREIQKIR